MTPKDALTLPRLPTLILLPGLDGTGDFFQPLLDEIAGKIPTTVVRYPIDGGYDYDSCLEIVQAMLPADEKYVLLGESFSGPLAVTLAALNAAFAVDSGHSLDDDGGPDDFAQGLDARRRAASAEQVYCYYCGNQANRRP